MVIKNMNGDKIGPKVDLTWVENMSEFNDLKSLQIFNGRTKAAAWFVSHCHTRSKRENYTKSLKYELNKLNLDLDVYGKCGALECPKRNRSCDDLLRNTYYFYLAFENSFAEDYITEKVITALMGDVVPILYGGANYSRFLPPGSYLDARKYKPEELASLMAHLIKTPVAYRDFFRWKNHYSYHRPKNICGLCAALNNQTMLEARSILDFRRWWNPDFLERCKDGLNWGT
ncbi:alpha-(1,3)-fucosyltransferase C-like [Choristoneura fumiferana]|uniref:alpha-(1,3)-fucosyltransferase C-like n=1 Tax=Choristoneura fumiferana TaxID=7141 RepID=UPI003D15437F